MSNFNVALSDYLRKHKLTQAEFCKRTGYDKGQVSKWLKGKNSIGLKTVWRIQKTFPDFALETNHNSGQHLSSTNKDFQKPNHLDDINLELTPLDNWKSIIGMMSLIESLRGDIEGLKNEVEILRSTSNSKTG